MAPAKSREVVITLNGMDCMDCVNKLQKALNNTDGIHSVSLNFSSGSGKINFDPSKLDLLKLDDIISKLGYEMVGEVVKYSLDQVHCRDCGRELENHLEKQVGVIDANVSLGSNIVSVNFVPKEIKKPSLEEKIKGMGYAILKSETDHDVGARRQRRTAVLIGAAGGIFVLGWMLIWLGMDVTFYSYTWNWFVLDLTLSNVLFLMSLILPGYSIFKEAFYSLKGRILNIDVLVVMAAIGAVLIGTYWEGAAVIFLTALGELMQDMSMEKTRVALAELLGSAPKTARVRRDGKIIEIEIGELEEGDVAIVKPGEKLPADGKILKGSATVNQAPITGESVPVCLAPGHEVFGGTLNEDGYLEIEVTKVGEDTTISKILRLVQEAQEEKAPAQQFIERFSEWFVPAVIILAVVTYFITQNVTAALTLLVVACPCALVISTPVAVVSSLGNAAKKGILIKGGAALEEMGRVKIVMFDKTGTLTTGKHGISEIAVFDGTELDVLDLAAQAEQKSEHPLSKAIMRDAIKKGVSLREPTNFEVYKGKGVMAELDGKKIIVGNAKLLEQFSVQASPEINTKSVEMEKKALTVFYVVEDSTIKGLIGTSDTIRKEAVKTIADLKKMGIQTIMISGDNTTTALAVGKKLGVDLAFGNLLPEDKVSKIKEYKEKGKVAMVGDGINDAPALATADVGIAMGGTGSDLAVETSDITLLSDDITRIEDTIRMSKKTLSIIKQNTGFALFVVIGLILSASVGWIGLAIGVIGHESSALIVIANSIRLLGKKQKAPDTADARSTGECACPTDEEQGEETARACPSKEDNNHVIQINETSQKSTNENHKTNEPEPNHHDSND